VHQEAQHQQEEPVSGSQAILTAIGVTLRNQRELLSLSLTDIEKYTHLRLHYLKALESGKLDDLPSPTQGRGMLNNYARFLNLDADRLLNKFADALIARREEKLGPGVPGQRGAQPRSAPKTPSRPGLFRFVSMDLLVGGSLILALIGVVVWTASQVMAVSSEPGGEPTAPSIAEVLLASPEVTSSLDLEAVETQAGIQSTAGFPAGSTGAETATPTPDGGLVSGGQPPLQEGEFQLSVIAMQRVWLKVVVDGQVEFMGRTKPGSVYTYPADERIELTTGNAAGIQIVYNQESLGPLGNWSGVVHTVYTVDGVFAPTATASATPTRTPRVTITPTPTETLQPSITPRSTIPAP
jgi:cytoskeletal protein RodZ